MITLSIVIPTLNEAGRLPDTLACHLQSTFFQPLKHELIVSDDGSKDQTVALSRCTLRDLPNHVILRGRHLGKGAAVRAGVAAAQGDMILVPDADGCVLRHELPALITCLNDEAHDVHGCRGHRHGTPPAIRALKRRAVSSAYLLAAQ